MVQRLYLMLPANHRNAIGVRHILRSAHGLSQLGGGVIVGARAAFFQNHIALRFHIINGQHQIDHSVSFHAHDQVQLVLGDILEIAGVIIGREGIVAPAVARHDLGELPRRDGWGTLEHQMFQEMRDP